MIERGIPPTSVPPCLQALATRVREWPHFEGPQSDVWTRTIFDVAMASDHIRAVREWSTSVWRGWSPQHEAIARFVGMHLDVG